MRNDIEQRDKTLETFSTQSNNRQDEVRQENQNLQNQSRIFRRSAISHRFSSIQMKFFANKSTNSEKKVESTKCFFRIFFSSFRSDRKDSERLEKEIRSLSDEIARRDANLELLTDDRNRIDVEFREKNQIFQRKSFSQRNENLEICSLFFFSN